MERPLLVVEDRLRAEVGRSLAAEDHSLVVEVPLRAEGDHLPVEVGRSLAEVDRLPVAEDLLHAEGVPSIAHDSR